MNRSDALRELARTPALRVCNLGYPSRELFQIADSPDNFYMLGSMGLASSVGLGLALGQDRRVLAIDGDGSVLMNLGTLATIGRYAPAHFCLVILDNGVHGSTGNQPTATSFGADLARVASACGVRRVRTVRTTSSLRRALREAGPSVIVAKVDPGNAGVPIVPLGGRALRDRFRARVSGRAARPGYGRARGSRGTGAPR
jgi:sulfopyruvate decarboxylase subunit beta